ncbi:MAG: SDR family oxidoreductase [Gammaproteobacteria bacterium]|nr:MAG: SDR family oxidoreductase [Gammaproteobacteria bacterium]
MKTVLITGANRGIGFALSQEYLAQGWQIIAVCRNSSAELGATEAKIIAGIDLTNPAHILRLVDQLISTPIDLLINNAGVLHPDNLGDIDYRNVSQQFIVNAQAQIQVTEALLDRLNDGAKIAFITSRMGSIADNSSGAYYGYRMSKAALNAGAKSLSIDLKPRGIAVAVLHPGYVQTAMVNFGGDISPGESAKRLVERIAELNMKNTGSFWHSNGESLPW